MSKRFAVLNDFSGGLNTVKDPRDIAANELASAMNVIGDKQGQLRTVGGVTVHADAPAIGSQVTQPNNGLFAYSTDHKKGAAAADTGEDWIALCDNTIDIQLYDVTGDSWNSPGSFESTGILPTFSFVDETLRIVDSNFVATNYCRWYGYIDRVHFIGLNGSANTGGRVDYDLWQWEKTAIAKPGTTPVITNSAYPTGGVSFNINAAAGGTDTGTWEAGDYEIVQSFIYDGNQESALSNPTSAQLTLAVLDSIVVTIMGGYADASKYNPRLTGARFYIRRHLSKNPWTLLVDIDMTQGARSTLDGNYDSWTVVSATTPFQFTAGAFTLFKPNISTYEILNGFSSEATNIDLGGLGEGYKTVAIAGRRAFSANMSYIPNGETIARRFRDKIMYTPIGRFDTWPREYYIDIVQGDSEDYVKLAFHADKLLAFKQGTLHIINIASPSPAGWEPAGKYPFMGVPNSACVFNTSYGIIWCNEFGVYLYDGSNIANLIDNRLDPAAWQTWFQSTSSIGYDPKKSQIVVVQYGGSTAGTIYIFDVKTRSWWLMDKPATIGTNNMTNFAIDYNKNLIYGQNVSGSATPYVWDMDKVQTFDADKIYFTTKDFDMNDPGRYKKFYSVVCTYRAAAGTASDSISYAVDGGTSFTDLIGAFAQKATTWGVVRCVPASPLRKQSLQLKVINKANSERLEINDLTLEVRTLKKAVRTQ